MIQEGHEAAQDALESTPMPGHVLDMEPPRQDIGI